MIIFVEIVLGYALADLLSGIYHLMTDAGYNLPAQIRDFSKHHAQPWTMTFDASPMIAGVPVMLGAPFFPCPWFFFTLGFGMSICQFTHYWTHNKPNRFVGLLQKARLIISPRGHWKHHKAPFACNFCILSGWNNVWMNAILRLCRYQGASI